MRGKMLVLTTYLWWARILLTYKGWRVSAAQSGSITWTPQINKQRRIQRPWQLVGVQTSQSSLWTNSSLFCNTLAKLMASISPKQEVWTLPMLVRQLRADKGKVLASCSTSWMSSFWRSQSCKRRGWIGLRLFVYRSTCILISLHMQPSTISKWSYRK